MEESKPAMQNATLNHPKGISGIKNFLAQLKSIAFFNRVNEMIVVGEFTKNKFNAMASDFHIRGIYNTETKQKLNWPATVSKICYNMTQEMQPEWKCYVFKSNPLEFKVSEELMLVIDRSLVDGRYGPYYLYRFISGTEHGDDTGNIII